MKIAMFWAHVVDYIPLVVAVICIAMLIYHIVKMHKKDNPIQELYPTKCRHGMSKSRQLFSFFNSLVVISVPIKDGVLDRCPDCYFNTLIRGGYSSGLLHIDDKVRLCPIPNPENISTIGNGNPTGIAFWDKKEKKVTKVKPRKLSSFLKNPPEDTWMICCDSKELPDHTEDYLGMDDSGNLTIVPKPQGHGVEYRIKYRDKPRD